MHLIVILICLGLDRFWQSQVSLRPRMWYNDVLLFLQEKFFSKKVYAPWLSIALSLLIILIPLVILQILLRHAYHGIPSFLFHIFVLYYCLNQTYLRRHLEHYFTAKEQQDIEAAYEALITQNIVLPIIETEQGLVRTTTKYLLTQANRDVIAVIFWYLVLGPAGALLYRFANMLAEYAQSSDESGYYHSLMQPTQELVELLLWIPARLQGLCYALAGNFMQSFTEWLKFLCAGLRQSDELLEKTGLAALGADATGNILPAEEIAALELIDRALVIALVGTALLTLGAWLG